MPLHVLALSLVVESASAEPSANTDLWTRFRLRAFTLSLAPVVGSDIAPGPPIDLVAAAFASPAHDVGRAPFPVALPPLRLRLELPRVFGITPFATTTYAPNSLARIPSTEVGAAYAVGPLRTGTRFHFWRGDSGLWLRNATFVRYVHPAVDFGLESTTDTALLGAPGGLPVIRRALEVSAGVHPTPEAPTVRVSSSVLATMASGFSSVSAFGRF